MLSSRLNRLNEQIAQANLNGRMDVQLRLLDRKNALLASKATDDDRDHLRYADAHVARRDDDALFEVAKGDFGPSAQRGVQVLQLAEIVFGSPRSKS